MWALQGVPRQQQTASVKQLELRHPAAPPPPLPGRHLQAPSAATRTMRGSAPHPAAASACRRGSCGAPTPKTWRPHAASSGAQWWGSQRCRRTCPTPHPPAMRSAWCPTTSWPTCTPSEACMGRPLAWCWCWLHAARMWLHRGAPGGGVDLITDPAEAGPSPLQQQLPPPWEGARVREGERAGQSSAGSCPRRRCTRSAVSAMPCTARCCLQQQVLLPTAPAGLAQPLGAPVCRWAARQLPGSCHAVTLGRRTPAAFSCAAREPGGVSSRRTLTGCGIDGCCCCRAGGLRC